MTIPIPQVFLATYINYIHCEINASLNEASTGDTTRCSWRIIAYVWTRHPAYAVTAIRSPHASCSAWWLPRSSTVAWSSHFQFWSTYLSPNQNLWKLRTNWYGPAHTVARKDEGESCCRDRSRISPLANSGLVLYSVSIATSTAKKPSITFLRWGARYLEKKTTKDICNNKIPVLDKPYALAYTKASLFKMIY